MQRSTFETLVGALVLAIAAVFVWFALGATGVAVSRDGYELGARFDRIDGINVGSDVRVSGIKVGTVTAASLDPKTYLADIRIRLPSTLSLPDDSIAQITADGLLGSRYVSLQPGASEAMLKPGSRIKFTTPPLDIMQLVGKYMFSAGGSQGAPSGTGPGPGPGTDGAPSAGGGGMLESAPPPKP